MITAPNVAESIAARLRSDILAARVSAIDAAIEAGDAAAAVRSLVRERRERLLTALDAIESERAQGAARDPEAATGSA